MEFTHDKIFSFTALILGMIILLLEYYGGIYGWLGAIIAFLGLILMGTLYFDLLMKYNAINDLFLIKSDSDGQGQ